MLHEFDHGDEHAARADWYPRRMFVDAATAARIDRVEARFSVAIAGALARPDPAHPPRITRFESGAAVYARPGSPINKLIGAGFDGPLDDAILTEIEASWTLRGEPVRVELASLASPEAAAQLGARGYRLIGCEHVLVRPFAPDDADRVPAHTILRDDPAWQRLLVDGFLAPDGTGAPADDYARDAIEAVMTDFAATPDLHRYVAVLEDAAGAATMRIDDRVALLCGATTLPAARRRGVQAALLSARLRDAARAGCDLAVITTSPGSLSQHNAVRQGFHLAYVRTLLVRAPGSA